MQRTGSSMEGLFILLFSSTLFSIFITSSSLDTITATQSVTDNETLVSASGTFELGFFSPGSIKNRYLGIWYKKVTITTVVWVANREIPITDSSGVFSVTNQGILVLTNRTNDIIWHSNSSRPTQRSPVAQLLESGNLVVRDENDDNPENFLWQSFDHPCDTLLADMKLGINRITGLDRYLSSWKSTDDPSQGDYTVRVDPHGFPQVILSKGSAVQARSGPWNGLSFSGTPGLKENPIYKFDFVFDQTEMYYSYEMINNSVVSRMVLSSSGVMQRSIWIDRTQGWILYLSAQMDSCDRFALCGPYGSCNINNSPVCGCLNGFVPKFPNDWDAADWSNGCVRKTSLDCKNGDGFNKYSGFKLPDTRQSWYNQSMNLEDCAILCLKNCSCIAYANSDIRGGGSGCLLWFDDLNDMRGVTENGQDLYIRMAASELGGNGSNSNQKKRVRIVVSSCLSIGMLALLFSLSLVWYIWKKKHKKDGKLGSKPKGDYSNENQKDDLELPLFDLATIATATNDFSIHNIVGEGGFGPVYKGVLKEGQEIAVKRLSKDSTQGMNEFKNEVVHIAKLQHRNLVKLLGCCLEEDETMLIYEFMPNKSLDSFIFDKTQRTLLDWPKRFEIINGIARGLLYLHQDSRLRIIHRDLKAGNVLLDNEMNPKISDFGMARSFGGNDIVANTKKVVGTYGYMSPEYAVDGLYSVKSDVFSFGVLVQEIVSGKRNRGFYHPDHSLNLLGHAWILFLEGRSLETSDESIGDSLNISQVLRSIHIGLLCVQRCPEDRPTMSSVVLMLGSEGDLPPPKQPGFFTERSPLDTETSSSKYEPFSTNETTITILEAR